MKNVAKHLKTHCGSSITVNLINFSELLTSRVACYVDGYLRDAVSSKKGCLSLSGRDSLIYYEEQTWDEEGQNWQNKESCEKYGNEGADCSRGEEYKETVCTQHEDGTITCKTVIKRVLQNSSAVAGTAIVVVAAAAATFETLVSIVFLLVFCSLLLLSIVVVIGAAGAAAAPV